MTGNPTRRTAAYPCYLRDQERQEDLAARFTAAALEGMLANPDTIKDRDKLTHAAVDWGRRVSEEFKGNGRGR